MEDSSGRIEDDVETGSVLADDSYARQRHVDPVESVEEKNKLHVARSVSQSGLATWPDVEHSNDLSPLRNGTFKTLRSRLELGDRYPMISRN